jgi:hypothetical protein
MGASSRNGRRLRAGEDGEGRFRLVPWILVTGILLAWMLVAMGCGGALAEGEAEFKTGRYPDAKATFAMLEPEVHRWDDSKRAEYALYRGLTLGALGDQAPAALWLREAKTIEAARPGALSAEDARRLDIALENTEGP